ncbi:MAG: AAA family ATPase, partial [Candidatus Eisenbacteria bacterium]|nr:AAA family ATPase [Candidatus Eisenbacteria bacterium]
MENELHGVGSEDDGATAPVRNGQNLAATGIAGLDAILRGGLPRDYSYLIQGDHGTGKTTLGLQFCMAGAREGERVLYVTLCESEAEIHEIARSHG